MRTLGDFPNLTAAMEHEGWPETKIRKIMGENWLRLSLMLKRAAPESAFRAATGGLVGEAITVAIWTGVRIPIPP
jgi:Membrane dipeptidase (Peptidase family M19)